MAEEAQPADKPVRKKGGPQPGSGRPKKIVTQLKDIAICNGLVWWKSPAITIAIINGGLNGDSGCLKILAERLWGGTPSIAMSQQQILDGLPEGFDPQGVYDAAQASLIGTAVTTDWTKDEAARVGRLGVRTLEALASRGDKQAAMALARALMPDPMLTLIERVETMTPEEKRRALEERFRSQLDRSGRYEAAMVEQIVADLVAREEAR